MTTNDLALFGAFGGVNVGDEAILYSVIDMLRRHGAGATVRRVIFSACPTAAARNLYDQLELEIVRKSDVRKLLQTLTSMRLVIGGGQLLNGALLPRGLLFILLASAVNRLFGFRPVIIGIGAENIQSIGTRCLLAGIVRMCTSIGCRDDHTYSSLQHLAPPGRVHRTADVVFVSAILALRTPRERPVRNRIVIAPHRDPRWKQCCTSQMPGLVLALTRAFPTKRITVVAHDVRPDFDAGLLNDLEARVKHNVEYCRLDSLTEAVDLYTDAEFVVSSRMHPLIIGMICGARPVALAESNKVRELCRELGLPSVSVASLGSSTSDAVIHTLNNWDSTSDHAMWQTLAQQQSLAMKNAECVTDDR